MSAPAADGRIPIRLEPIPGESFDGWLDAYAQRLRTSTVALGQALGVAPTLLRARAAKLALAHPAPDHETIAARACGLDPARIEALWVGLQRYDHLLTRRLGPAMLARATRPLAWSRYCPSCLTEHAGRWMAAWRLPWYLACPTHLTMLTSTCPGCDGQQRDRPARAAYVDDVTTVCCRPTGDSLGRGDNRCRQPLTGSSPGQPAVPELIALQAELLPILQPDLSGPEADRLVDRLVDVLTVATHVGLDLQALTHDRRDATRAMAGPLVEAQRVLADPDGERLRALASGDSGDGPPKLPVPWKTASPALTAVLLRHRDARLRPTDRLRFRSMTGAGRRPEGRDPSARLSFLPLALWPDWAIRLRPPTIDSNNFRITTAAALCLPGATATLRQVAGHWPASPSRLNLTRLGRLIAQDAHGTAILGALCALTDEVDRDGAPIDYARRRALASHIPLLDPKDWTAMCRAGHTPTGHEFKLHNARLWLWETLTGGMAQQAPASLRPPTPTDLPRYQTFALQLPGQTIRGLLDHARGLLDDNGCPDEPLTWSPAGDAISTATLPGSDPNMVSPERARALLARGLAPGDAATQLGVTLEHLRNTIRTHVPDGSTQPPSDLPPRARLAAAVTPQQLRQQIEDGTTLRALAARYDVARDTMRKELVAHNIPIPPHGGRSRYHLEAGWLRQQYLVKQRTMPDIAAETGATPATIARLIQKHGIPARGRGAPSHQASLTAGDGYPHPLATAVMRPGGTERVRRFQVYARTRSLNVAAKHLSVHQCTLTTQLAALETACAGTLLNRLSRDQQAQRLTALGRTLLDQADRHLGPHPDAPPDLPRPLATVLAAHWGPKMLTTFAEAATFATINDAAHAAGVHATSLQRTIRNLERSVGEPVLHDHRASARIGLTPIAHKLLRQHDRHWDLTTTT